MCDLSKLRDMFRNEIGTPGKWELLFDENDALIKGEADRLEVSNKVKNPFYKEAIELGKPVSVYIREERRWPTIPVLYDREITDIFEEAGCLCHLPHFCVAGEPDYFKLDPADVRAGILVAGGNAAGLNMVVDSIVKRITGLASKITGNRDYRPEIYGYVGGYVGLKALDHFGGRGKKLTIEDTDPRAGDPCIFLKTLRGEKYDSAKEEERGLSELAESVIADKLNILFVIGGNGTFTWADRLHKTLKKKGHKISIVGGPKTMDMDINFADATFGFRTAVDNAVKFIQTAHWEAVSQNRIAVMEFFGAGSGFVALHAGFLSGEADYIMIPEIEVTEEQVFKCLQERLNKRQHAVLVIAEGALEDFKHGNREQKELAFGNFVKKLKVQFSNHGLVDIRPRYLIRGTVPNSFDLDLAKYTGYLMADAALSGFTGCSVQLWQGNYVLVPLMTAVTRPGKVQLWSPYYWYMAQRYLLPK